MHQVSLPKKSKVATHNGMMNHPSSDKTSATSLRIHIGRRGWKPRRGGHGNEQDEVVLLSEIARESTATPTKRGVRLFQKPNHHGPSSPKFSSIDDDSLYSMETTKPPLDADDSFDARSHAAQDFDRQANHLIDPFSPSPNSKSYFVDIHAREVSQSPSVHAVRPIDISVRRSHSPIKPPRKSISPIQPRSTSPLPLFPSPDAHSGTLFYSGHKPQPRQVSFLDMPQPRPEKTRRSYSVPLLVRPPPSTFTRPPTPIPTVMDNLRRRSHPFRCRLQSFRIRRVHRRCRAGTWLRSLWFSARKTASTTRGDDDNDIRSDASNPRRAGDINSTPNLNDVISNSVTRPSFANSVIKSIYQTTEEDDRKMWYDDSDYDDNDIRSGGGSGEKDDEVCEVAAWFESNALPSQPSRPRPPATTGTAPQVMETMRLFENGLADDIVSLVDWGEFCRELLERD